MQRGIIRNREYATQVRDFSGLRFGTITPTDIDGLLDFGNRVFVLIETKYGNNDMPYGQRLAIARLIDALEKAGKAALGIIAQHNSDGDIDVGACVVTELRFGQKWTTVDSVQTVREWIDRFLRKHAPEYLEE